MKKAEPAPPPDELHPLDAHLIRAPVPPTAAVRVVVLSEIGEEGAQAIGQGLRRMLAGKLRGGEVVVDCYPHDSRARRLALSIEGATEPLVLVTTAAGPCPESTLNSLLQAIDRSDHALAGGKRGPLAWLASRPWKFLFALPVRDPHAPFRLHRRECLEKIPLQASSDFLDIEVLAKATFLTHLIEDTRGSSHPARRLKTGRIGDFLEVFLRPRFKRSRPLEYPEGEQEGCDPPGKQDTQAPGHVE